jgi:prephenate dehydrogenase
MEILIVGAGAMGTWIGRVLRQEFEQSVSVVYHDANPENEMTAADTVDGQRLEHSETESFDVVCIAVPIPATEETIAKFASRADNLVFDVTGTMAEPVEAMAQHAPDCERMSLHPLFAPENEPGNIPVVVAESGPLAESVLDALDSRGNTVFETTPAEHDEMMETVQAKTHAAILAFAVTADNVPPEFQTPVSDGLLDLARQVTDGEPRVFSDIQEAFDGASDVATAATDLSDADRETFEVLYENASDVMHGQAEDR